MIQQLHRWVGIAFTMTVAANFIAMGIVGEPPALITYSPLPFLFVQLFSGLWLFASPYMAAHRSGGPN